MKIFPFLLVLTLLCLLPADINGEKKVREKRNPVFLLSLILKLTLPFGMKLLKELTGISTEEPSTREHKEIMRELVQISSEIKNFESEVKNSVDTAVTTLLRTFPKIVQLELDLHDLRQIINHINFAEEQMRAYVTAGYKNVSASESETHTYFKSLQSQTKTTDFHLLEELFSNMTNRTEFPKRIMTEYTMIDFATWATTHSPNSIMSLLRRMNDMIVRGEKRGLFDNVLDVLSELSSEICTLKHSPYQSLYNLYTAVAVAELKGNYVLQFAYTLLKMYNKGNFSEESKRAFNVFEKNAKEKLEKLIQVLPSAERSIYNCDAPKQVDGETYTYLVRFLQAYIENEENLDWTRSCWKTCEKYSPKTKYYGCHGNKFCIKQPKCGGPVLNCRSASDNMQICRSTRKDRRYDWIKYSEGKVYGKGGYCYDDNYFTVKSRWKHFLWRCSYCLCTCDDKSEASHRYFNLRNVMSDRKKNKVVTGVRIVKNNQIIHLQIQEGVLNPLGHVNITTLSWKPVDNYTVWDTQVKNNKDYFTMDNEQRALDTNELTALPGYVVTGIRFRQRETHLDLDVHVTPFDFTSGKLELVPEKHSYWISKNNTHPQTGRWRSEITLWEPDVPTRLGPHSLNSRKNQYILFRETDFVKDAGQSTVPYFDSQPLTSDGFAIAGFGLIHRGKSGSGGYIAPKLVSYDFAAHLNFIRSN